MRLYDPAGVYSTDDIRNALEAALGSRTIQFKFERLDYLNRSIDWLDYIVDATVNNSALADIKRTATFTIRDNGAINYLSDRIRPYIGVQMADGGYVWWPQGVFLLSTPSRTYQAGAAVFRDVDGYDQLQVLTDDKVLARYTADAGAKYTDVIQDVISSQVTNYAINGNAVATSGTWGTYYSPTASYLATSGKYGTTSYQVVTTGAQVEGIIAFSDTAAFSGAVTASIWVKGTNGTSWVVAGRTGGPYAEGQSSYTHVTNGNWQRISVTYSVPTGTQQFGIQIRQSTPSSGVTLQADGALMTVGTRLFDFFDGANGGIWVGTTNASRSYKSISNFSSQITPSTLTLPAAIEWEPGTSRLKIVNDLLAAINYKSATFNEEGDLVCAPYINPQDRAPEYTYSVGERSLISGDVGQTIDLFDVPNQVVLVVSNPDTPALYSTAQNNNPASPTSIVNRGRIIVDYESNVDAPDQATLDAKAVSTLAGFSQVYEEVTFSTPIMPVHQDSDVYNLEIEGLAIADSYNEVEWKMPLMPGGRMSHTVRKVVTV